ncbi:class I SAM-dependent methyltransferase [Peribacillus sp. SCS-155]|uniref:class I SAM-dependent methyltransferase n=1 Tax=Peribacillus sedimenti TaxID=3115297 RepID=UPI003906B564
MKLDRILPFARVLLEKAIREGDIAVDATTGNGFDTVFLAQLAGNTGHIYGFDIQQEALEATAARLNEQGLANCCTLIHSGHENIKNHIPESVHHRITAAIFNLGYLPGGDKQIVTRADTTISAIEQLLEIMAAEGLIILVIYHGHPEGAVEKDELLRYVSSLPQDRAHVLQYGFINQVNQPPFIIAIEKR